MGPTTVPYPVLVSQLEAEVAFLREQVSFQQRQLDDAARERAELRQLMAMQLTQTLPPGRPTTSTDDPPTPPEPPQRRHRWWRW